ncbi:MAG: response regulator [Campylobacterota bacterium]|nr:response regulator [Campylobacterota bacterium]
MLNVMLVDDSITIRRVLRNVLERMMGKDNINICEAGDGVEAFSVLGANPEVTLIMLDVNMPEMNGTEFLEKLRKNPEHNDKRVIMVTTEAEKKAVMRHMKLGANGYIAKPFTPVVMKKSLTPILARMGIDIPAE